MSSGGRRHKNCLPSPKEGIHCHLPSAFRSQIRTEHEDKEKKVMGKKEEKHKASKTATHPPYFHMIKEALDEKDGSSPYAIAKHTEKKHKDKLPANFRKIVDLFGM
ncbi:PREDICTED: histone H1-like [Ipomoea nil]|uniref:histone H1-like n=1 Tax=Ipomoea nil TaxID=35883 RepID=UPI000900E9C6|nr:PREDICTED: histone H1-like [Ipomoea nil]